uniref:Uncharacterized protein n=1 Tax=Neobodo designis TaxID=312471 RepID=A0A7S1M5R3_NEODS|mmetsp:Transcript_34765/g.107359  ORF Transcript_34765/g.107359 Transcript_34765/m.107359 type:complete len:194 (+) Transcript_34765:42-623(+)|eukprot:CAMPEP_0174849796 /NCGR_PEP_ID=MMETSP1114-20130205/17462_1 /TAXON_ID=312471 /ORGANISM="Neobodo designis, Strain CCAP 1951/1" /LENGTH=193 /DNA_ID=CAMNT_0016084199 /DNA_START=43 /DNA_END=624 /DNA_ORIENTATION=+
MQGQHATVRILAGALIAPAYARNTMAIENASKVERGVRLQTALKANKVDLRHLLALPATDPAHPYKTEYPWEKLMIRADPRQMTMYGKWYYNRVFALYEIIQQHRQGVYYDDMINLKGWWSRAARTRCPKPQVVHMDRRVLRYRDLKEKWLYDKKENWVSPVDNTGFYAPYCTMVADEWEEKWGFFAGNGVEY